MTPLNSDTNHKGNTGKPSVSVCGPSFHNVFQTIGTSKPLFVSSFLANIELAAEPVSLNCVSSIMLQV